MEGETTLYKYTNLSRQTATPMTLRIVLKQTSIQTQWKSMKSDYAAYDYYDEISEVTICNYKAYM